MEKKEIKIKNPLTGKWIKKNGPTYNNLLKNNLISNSMKKTKSPFKPPSSYKVTSIFKSYPVDKREEYWKNKKPHSISERKYILDHCGESCFLMPNELKFPICNKTLPCTYNCRGLKGASSRAGEWKYKDVLKKSKELTSILGCYKKK